MGSSDVPSMTAPVRPFIGRPFAWLLFSLLVLIIPIAGAMWRAQMSWDELHPAINAVLNGSAAFFLVAGFFAIKKRNIGLHRLCMVSAVVASGVFLASYLARFYMSGTHRYAGEGWDKTLYLVILFSHMILAAVVVPLVLRALWLAKTERFEGHRRVVRWLWPMWIYVSVTGVVVYLMLYHVAA